jgi:hypothetical protein
VKIKRSFGLVLILLALVLMGCQPAAQNLPPTPVDATKPAASPVTSPAASPAVRAAPSAIASPAASPAVAR